MWEGVRISKNMEKKYEDAKCLVSKNMENKYEDAKCLERVVRNSGKPIRLTCKDCGTGTVMESSGVPDTALWYLHCEAILPQITKAPLAPLFPFVFM